MGENRSRSSVTVRNGFKFKNPINDVFIAFIEAMICSKLFTDLIEVPNDAFVCIFSVFAVLNIVQNKRRMGRVRILTMSERISRACQDISDKVKYERFALTMLSS